MTNNYLSLPLIESNLESSEIYRLSLDARVPITIAIVYIAICTTFQHRVTSGKLNGFSFCQGKAFFRLTIFHNSLLAIYSAASFLGFARVLFHVASTAWNTGDKSYRNERIMDLICHLDINLHKTSGAASEYVHGRTRESWLEANLTYGWFFYISKMYELLDTFIIVGRGKPPGLFQIYHHAGALLCVWAGLVYRATPLWSFIFMNCGIHALMYTYYNLVLFKVKISRRIKITLTTLQILQTTVAVIYATWSLFGVHAISGRSLDSAGHGKGLISHIPCTLRGEERAAIALNIVYLVPLLCLFLKFFLANYLRIKHYNQN